VRKIRELIDYRNRSKEADWSLRNGDQFKTIAENLMKITRSENEGGVYSIREQRFMARQILSGSLKLESLKGQNGGIRVTGAELFSEITQLKDPQMPRETNDQYNERLEKWKQVRPIADKLLSTSQREIARARLGKKGGVVVLVLGLAGVVRAENIPQTIPETEDPHPAGKFGSKAWARPQVLSVGSP
jgi:hypothetical protein